MDADLYAQALADIRSIPAPTQSRDEPEPSCDCLRGRLPRSGYEWHRRNGTAPCAPSRAAHAAYHRAYSARHREAS